MSDARDFTIETGVEQLLRDSALPDLFGSPPPNLVQQAMAAIAKPCAERRSLVQQQRATALIVLSLTAAGMFLTTLPGANMRLHTNRALNSPSPEMERSSMLNQHGDHTAQTVHSIANEPAPISASRQRRRRMETDAARLRPPKAIWTKTVVCTSEEGVVLPVGSMVSAGENGPDRLVASGLAVVPLHSGLTYTGYSDADAP